MSSNVGNYISCPNIQGLLNGKFGQLSGQYREPVPFVEFLNSPLNTQGVLQSQIDAGNGHYRAVQVIYETRYDEGDVVSTAVQSCSGGNKPGETSHTYQIDPAVGVSYKWSALLTDLAARCEGDETWFPRQVQRALDALVRKMDTLLVTKAATLKGKFATSGATTAITLKTKDAGSTIPNQYIPNAMEDARYEFMQLDYSGPIVMFGGAKLYYNYFNQMGITCCNTTLGLDMSAVFAKENIAPFFDRRVETAFGTNHVLAMAPGALQLITYNAFRGPNGIRVLNQDTFKQGVIYDPYTGLPFDYTASFDCGTWNFQLKLAYDLVGLPTDMFGSADRMSGVTWVNDFVINNT